VLGGMALHPQTSGAGRARPQDIRHGPVSKMAVVKPDGLHRLWSAMAVQVDPCTTTFFHSLVHVVVGDGKAPVFWNDRWIDGQCIIDFAPDLVEVVPHH
jgi:hypothetical protein